MRKMRKWKAWALLNSHGNLFTRDYRLPLTWFRRAAQEDAKDYGGRIIRVEVRELPQRRGRK